MLLTLTATTADGKQKKFMLSSSEIKEISLDERPESPSKAIVWRKDGFRYFVAEDIEYIASLLSRSEENHG